MKAGDLVRSVPHGILTQSGRVGIVVNVIQKKCWRTEELGPMIDWRKIDAEPHAVVLFSHNEGTVNIPIIDLEVVDESRLT